MTREIQEKSLPSCADLIPILKSFSQADKMQYKGTRMEREKHASDQLVLKKAAYDRLIGWFCKNQEPLAADFKVDGLGLTLDVLLKKDKKKVCFVESSPADFEHCDIRPRKQVDRKEVKYINLPLSYVRGDLPYKACICFPIQSMEDLATSPGDNAFEPLLFITDERACSSDAAVLEEWQWLGYTESRTFNAVEKTIPSSCLLSRKRVQADPKHSILTLLPEQLRLVQEHAAMRVIRGESMAQVFTDLPNSDNNYQMIIDNTWPAIFAPFIQIDNLDVREVEVLLRNVLSVLFSMPLVQTKNKPDEGNLNIYKGICCVFASFTDLLSKITGQNQPRELQMREIQKTALRTLKIILMLLPSSLNSLSSKDFGMLCEKNGVIEDITQLVDFFCNDSSAFVNTTDQQIKTIQDVIDHLCRSHFMKGLPLVDRCSGDKDKDKRKAFNQITTCWDKIAGVELYTHMKTGQTHDATFAVAQFHKEMLSSVPATDDAKGDSREKMRTKDQPSSPHQTVYDAFDLSVHPTATHYHHVLALAFQHKNDRVLSVLERSCYQSGMLLLHKRVVYTRLKLAIEEYLTIREGPNSSSYTNMGVARRALTELEGSKEGESKDKLSVESKVSESQGPEDLSFLDRIDEKTLSEKIDKALIVLEKMKKGKLYELTRRFRSFKYVDKATPASFQAGSQLHRVLEDCGFDALRSRITLRCVGLEEEFNKLNEDLVGTDLTSAPDGFLAKTWGEFKSIRKSAIASKNWLLEKKMLAHQLGVSLSSGASSGETESQDELEVWLYDKILAKNEAEQEGSGDDAMKIARQYKAHRDTPLPCDRDFLLDHLSGSMDREQPGSLDDQINNAFSLPPSSETKQLGTLPSKQDPRVIDMKLIRFVYDAKRYAMPDLQAKAMLLQLKLRTQLYLKERIPSLKFNDNIHRAVIPHIGLFANTNLTRACDILEIIECVDSSPHDKVCEAIKDVKKRISGARSWLDNSRLADLLEPVLDTSVPPMSSAYQAELEKIKRASLLVASNVLDDVRGYETEAANRDSGAAKERKRVGPHAMFSLPEQQQVKQTPAILQQLATTTTKP